MKSKPFKPWIWVLVSTLFVFAVYAPILHGRLLRMAGDEKVYVSQALEMEQRQAYFVQTLQDKPDYYKGPLHYLLLRVGLGTFGHTPWGVLYMNVLFLILGSLSLGAIIRRHYPQWRGGEIFVGGAFTIGVGIYAHALASQMEIELAGLFALSFFLLDRLKPREAGFLFWTIAGVIGWSKSPLHSVFLGVSALLFWLIQGEFQTRFTRWQTWLAGAWGVLVCILGYLPAYLADTDHFMQFYVGRETFLKSSSGQHWSVSINSTFGFYLFPFLLVGLVAYAQFGVLIYRSLKDSDIGTKIDKGLGLGGKKFGSRIKKRLPLPLKRLSLLAFCGFVPSAVFFAIHPYHFENYNLPVIGAVWLLIAAVWGNSATGGTDYTKAKEKAANAQAREITRAGRTRTRTHSQKDWSWDRAYRWAIGLTAVLILILPLPLTGIVLHYTPMPAWWWDGLLPLTWVGAVGTAAGYFYFGCLRRTIAPHGVLLSSVGLYWALGAILLALGERELIDVRTYLKENADRGRTVQLGYFNLSQNIWSEWGMLNLWLGQSVRGIHMAAALEQAIESGQTVLVASKENGVTDFQSFIRERYPHRSFRWIPWKRWRTRGQGDHGQTLWRESWEKRDLSVLETDYFIVETVTAKAIQDAAE